MVSKEQKTSFTADGLVSAVENGSAQRDNPRRQRKGAGLITNSLAWHNKSETVVLQHIDVEMVRIHPEHDRHFQHLNEENCKDLIDSIRAHGQKQPILVRPIAPTNEDTQAKYEVVYGARRYWTCRYLRIPVISQIEELDDLQAFLISDSENSVKQDISAYERGLKYKKGLQNHFASIRQMADKLNNNISRSMLKYLIDFGSAPEMLVKKLKNIYKEKESDYRKLRPLIIDDKGEINDKAQKILVDMKDHSATLVDVMRAINGAQKREVPQKFTIHSPQGDKVEMVIKRSKDKVQVEFAPALLDLNEEDFIARTRKIWEAHHR